MSDIKDNGGPAFPVQNASTWQAHGMTLRDYFAAKAMAALVTADEVWLMQTPHEVSVAAYACADAMLKERAK